MSSPDATAPSHAGPAHARRRVLATFALAAATLLLACQPGNRAPLPSGAQPLATLADKPTLAGDTFDATALTGKVVLVNFWNPG